jgi:cbb3-type cytochrome oxidase subunit 1
MARENRYGYQAVKGFVIFSLFRGIVGLSIGFLISFQSVYPQFNFTSWFANGRLRLLHTNVHIYAFTVPAAFSSFFFLVRWLGRTLLSFPGSRSESC